MRSAPKQGGSIGRNSISLPPGCGSVSRNRCNGCCTDHVEILLAHDIENADDFERVFTETAEVLHRLKAEGKARFIGMSCYPLGLLNLAIERCNLDVVISYCHFNLQEQTVDFRTAARCRGAWRRLVERQPAGDGVAYEARAAAMAPGRG